MAKATAPGKLNQRINLRHLASQWGGSPLTSGATEEYLRSLVTANPALRGQTFALGGHQYVRPVTVSQLNAGQQSVFDLMSQTLKDWGLTTLLPDLKKLILKGDTAPDTLALALSGTDAYKKRFAANELRTAKGLPQLKPAEYIAAEEQYNNIMRAYGLPKGFYDQHSDFTQFLANDVSPTELEDRVKIATSQYMNADAAQRHVWERYFGLTPGDAVAHMLDPSRYSMDELQRKAQQAGIGTAAAEQGITVSQGRAQAFQEQGVTLAQAQKAYQDIAASMSTDALIARRFGTTFGQTQEEEARLLGKAADVNRLQTLQGEERGLFEGRAGATSESNAPNLSAYL